MSKKCVIVSNTAENQETTFTITDSKFYGPVVTLSTQDNVKLLQQLKSGFKRTIICNKYQSKVTIQAPNPYIDQIDRSFQRVNILFVLLFENKDDITVQTFKKITFKKKQLVKEKITLLVVCWIILIITIDLSKQQALDGDPKTRQQNKFTESINRDEDVHDNTIMIFIIEEAREPVLDFSQGTVKVL